MWQPAVGMSEIVLLALVLLIIWLPGGVMRRFAVGVVPCFAIAMLVTPADLYSMLIVGIPLSLAFVCGVACAPSIRTSENGKPA